MNNPLKIKKGVGLVETKPNPFYPYTIYLCGTLEDSEEIADLLIIDLLEITGNQSNMIDLGTLD